MPAISDPRDPILRDIVGERGVLAIIGRCRRWIDTHSDRPDLYCEHGSYVGFKRSLAYLCPRCPEI